MSVQLYDEALVKKLKNVTENTNIHVYSPDDTKRLFEIIADESDDKSIKLPIICLRRNDAYTLQETGNNARSKNSLTVYAITKNDESCAIQLNEIPISISYNIDVYSRKLKEADEIMRELVFILTNSPNVDIVIPYNGLNYLHRSALSLETQVRDNSSIPERLVSGQFTRFTLTCNIPDAHLFDTRVKPMINIIGDGLVIHTSDSDIEIEKLDLNNKNFKEFM